MFKLIYAGSVLKDLRKVSPDQLPKIKNSVAELEFFPNFSQVKKRFRIELLSKVVFELKIKRQSGFPESPRFHQRIVHLQSPLPGNQSHVTFSNFFLHIVPA
mgnify:CR=1 FL=1